MKSKGIDWEYWFEQSPVCLIYHHFSLSNNYILLFWVSFVFLFSFHRNVFGFREPNSGPASRSWPVPWSQKPSHWLQPGTQVHQQRNPGQMRKSHAPLGSYHYWRPSRPSSWESHLLSNYAWFQLNCFVHPSWAFQSKKRGFLSLSCGPAIIFQIQEMSASLRRQLPKSEVRPVLARTQSAACLLDVLCLLLKREPLEWLGSHLSRHSLQRPKIWQKVACQRAEFPCARQLP